MEKSGGKNGTVFCNLKIFFRAGVRLEIHGLTDGEIPLYHMEKSRGQNGTVFCKREKIFFSGCVGTRQQTVFPSDEWRDDLIRE